MTRTALLEKMIADRTAAEGVYVVTSRSNPFVEYRCNPRLNKCECPAKRGSCWHLKAASAADRLGVTVSEVLRRINRAKDLGWCASLDCKFCLLASVNRWPCPASPAARAYIAVVEVNRQIEAQGIR